MAALVWRRGSEPDSLAVVSMTWPNRDELNRTAKMLIDSRRASSFDEAIEILEGFVLQVDVGVGIESDPAGQAALSTLVNAGSRAFLGGVVVRAESDPVLTDGWAAGFRLSDIVTLCGGQMVDEVVADHPTVVVGSPKSPPIGGVVLWTTWSGWAGGLVESEADRLTGNGLVLSGVLAGGFGVSEAFQSCMGSATAAHRDVGLSLWRPDLDWRHPDAAGPPLGWLPSRLWLLGLGHLGQGYGWSLGWLPYLTPNEVLVYLMDTDSVVKGNSATGLLLRPGDLNRRKTRVLSERLESLGMRTAIVERLYDDTLWPDGDEPLLALAGFDNPEPRRLLGGLSDRPRLGRVVDAGLGAGPVEYSEMMIHAFPSQLDPQSAFPDAGRGQLAMAEAYSKEIDRRIAAGEDPGHAACGVTDIAGITVGAAFVGAVAGAVVIGDVLRHLHGGIELARLSFGLRNPAYVDCSENSDPGDYFNPGSTAPRGH
jgi:hypothetical protein